MNIFSISEVIKDSNSLLCLGETFKRLSEIKSVNLFIGPYSPEM